MKYLFLKLMLFISLKLLAPGQQNHVMILKLIEEKKQNELYEITIKHIMKVEGFRSEPYICPAGHKTIGFGHVITKNDTFTSLNEKQALKLLKIDFDKMFQKTNPKLKFNQRLAIAHFTFNTGRYYYEKSLLKKNVDAGLPINNLIIKYRFYKKNGNYIESKHLLKSRIFELKLYNLK